MINLRKRSMFTLMAGLLCTLTVLAPTCAAVYSPMNGWNAAPFPVNGPGQFSYPLDRQLPPDAFDHFRQYQTADHVTAPLSQHSFIAHRPPTSSYYSVLHPAGRLNNPVISNERRDLSARTHSDSAASKPTTTYTVQSGDTLYRIANFFDTTVDLIMMENGISDPTKLKIGQKLTIPTTDDHMTWLDENSEITKTFLATLTAYTAGYESTGKTPSHPQYGITSSGEKVKENVTIAVDPSVIPMGSLVYIEGIGIRKAQDTGSAIKGNKIDVYIPGLQEALQFGVKKNVKVYVLDSSSKDVHIASASK